MDKLDEFKTLLSRNFDKSKVATVWAEVTEVQASEKTCTAKGLTDGLEYFDINLGFGVRYEYPNVGSRVLLGKIENKDENVFLIHASEVSKTEHIVGDNKMILEPDGTHLERNGEDLKSVLNDWIDEVSKIVVVQGNTINVAAMQKIKTRLNTILK